MGVLTGDLNERGVAFGRHVGDMLTVPEVADGRYGHRDGRQGRKVWRNATAF